MFCEVRLLLDESVRKRVEFERGGLRHSSYASLHSALRLPGEMLSLAMRGGIRPEDLPEHLKGMDVFFLGPHHSQSRDLQASLNRAERVDFTILPDVDNKVVLAIYFHYKSPPTMESRTMLYTCIDIFFADNGSVVKTSSGMHPH